MFVNGHTVSDGGEGYNLRLSLNRAMAVSYVDMAEFESRKEGVLQRFLQLRHGPPSHDTFSRIFRALDADQFGACFQVLPPCTRYNAVFNCVRTWT